MRDLSINQRFWADAYIESCHHAVKSFYLYLLTSPGTNNLGLLNTSRRKMAFEFGATEDEVSTWLAALERAGKVVVDGGFVWVRNFIKFQCTASPKVVSGLRRLLACVTSDAIRKAIIDRYPHILSDDKPTFGKGLQTLSLLSRYRKIEKEKISADAAPVEGASANPCESAPAQPAEQPASLVVTEDLKASLVADFPNVDYDDQIVRARNWCAMRGQSIRNTCFFLRKWFSNAAKQQAEVAPVSPSPAAPLKPQTTPPVGTSIAPAPVRTPSDAEWHTCQNIGKRVLDALRGNGTFSVEAAQGVMA